VTLVEREAGDRDPDLLRIALRTAQRRAPADESR
jgi:hypothetical protein